MSYNLAAFIIDGRFLVNVIEGAPVEFTINAGELETKNKIPFEFCTRTFTRRLNCTLKRFSGGQNAHDIATLPQKSREGRVNEVFFEIDASQEIKEVTSDTFQTVMFAWMIVSIGRKLASRKYCGASRNARTPKLTISECCMWPGKDVSPKTKLVVDPYSRKPRSWFSGYNASL